MKSIFLLCLNIGKNYIIDIKYYYIWITILLFHIMIFDTYNVNGETLNYSSNGWSLNSKSLIVLKWKTY